MFQQLCVCSCCLLYYSSKCLFCYVFVCGCCVMKKINVVLLLCFDGNGKAFWTACRTCAIHTKRYNSNRGHFCCAVSHRQGWALCAYCILLFLFQLSVQAGLLQGPHIATVTMAAYECNSVNFPEPPYPNEWVPDWCSDLPLLLCAVFSRPRARWCDCLFVSVMPTSPPVCCVLKASCSLMWLFIC